MLTAAGVPQLATPAVGDVPKKGRHKVEVVRMPSPRPWAGWQTTKIQRKNGKTETTGKNEATKGSLKDSKEWDLTDSSNGLVKLQHKLQQTMRREDTKVGSGHGGARRSHMRLPHSS